MNALWLRFNDYLIRTLWDVELDSLGRLKALGIKLLRMLHLFILEFSDEQLALRAMSLVYTTLLSLVPLLAVSFSVLKAFGVHAKLLIILYYFLEPLGPKGVDLAMKIIEFVENVKVSVIGAVGLSALIYTVMSLIQKIESALNYIWRIRGVRGFTKRFNSYMSMLLAGPVLIFSAASVVASLTELGFVQSLMKIEFLGPILYFVSKLFPYVVVSMTFAFIYMVLPNTKVNSKAALSGGIFAGILWTIIGHVFTFLIASPAKYSAIYSGFAVLILFLIWLYWNFFILLAGARISFYSQYPQTLSFRRSSLPLSNRLREKLALLALFHISYSFHHNKQPWSVERLAVRLRIPADTLQNIITILQQKGLVISSNEENPGLYPSRDPEIISVREVIDAVRHFGEDAQYPDRYVSSVAAVDEIMQQMEAAASRSIEETSLRMIVLKS